MRPEDSLSLAIEDIERVDRTRERIFFTAHITEAEESNERLMLMMIRP